MSVDDPVVTDVSPDDPDADPAIRQTQPGDADPVFASIGREIRAIRKRRRLTLEEVATAAGLTTGYLSQIERGVAVPTVTALKRVADGLRVHLASFFQDEDLASPFGLVRKNERTDVRHPISGQVFQQLTRTWSGRMSAAFYTLRPGEQTERMGHAGEEFAFVLSGEIEYRVGSRCYRMTEGDSLYFDCVETHCVINVGCTEAEWIWVSAFSL